MPDFSFLDNNTNGSIRINAKQASSAKPRKREPGMLQKMLALLLIGGCVYAVISMNHPYVERYVSAQQFGEDWPLTVGDGHVRAYRDNLCITFVNRGREYAANGIARNPMWGFSKISAIEKPGHTCQLLVAIGLELQKQVQGSKD